MTIIIILLIVTYILNLIDYAQTIYVVQIFGTCVEVNPIGRFLLENNLVGICKIVLAPILLSLMGWILKDNEDMDWAAYVVFVAYIAVVLHNFVEFIQMGIFQI